jgi:hypothetical protein
LASRKFSRIYSFFSKKPRRLAWAIILNEIGHWKALYTCGHAPSDQDWKNMGALPDPWGGTLVQGLQTLRKKGARVLPLLQRIESAVFRQKSHEENLRAQLSQAYAQVLTMAILTPLSALALTFFLEGPSRNPTLWGLAVGVATLMNGIAAYTLLLMSRSASRGALPEVCREWPISGMLGLEYCIALIQSGETADTAWQAMIQYFRDDRQRRLVDLWGASIWVAPDKRPVSEGEQIWERWGESFRRVIQLSLMDGTPCVDRLQLMMADFEKEWGHRVEKKIREVSQKALIPLFILVFPSVVGLMGIALFFELGEVGWLE